MHCEPYKKFNTMEELRAHMKKIHWCSTFFQDLSYEKKIASVKAKELYLGEGYMSVKEPDYKVCNCGVIKQGEKSAFKINLHEMIAGHRPYHKCARCGIMVHPSMLGFHLHFQCDDVKASQALKKNNGRMPGFQALDHA